MDTETTTMDANYYDEQGWDEITSDKYYQFERRFYVVDNDGTREIAVSDIAAYREQHGKSESESSQGPGTEIPYYTPCRWVLVYAVTVKDALGIKAQHDSTTDKYTNDNPYKIWAAERNYVYNPLYYTTSPDSIFAEWTKEADAK